MAINECIEEQDQLFSVKALKHCSKDGKGVLISEGIVFKKINNFECS